MQQKHDNTIQSLQEEPSDQNTRVEWAECEKLQIELMPQEKALKDPQYDLDRIIFDLDQELDSLTNHADELDYLIAIASGVLCSMLDILWVGEFSLERGRNIASNQVDGFVVKASKMLGCRADDVSSAVAFLEKKFPIPSDGNTPDFGGGLQHHLRDFAHHPTIVGLLFSLLTQFTEKSFGTYPNGAFRVVDIPEKSKAFIGENIPSKIIYGTLTWFFHLVSDMAGSSSSAGKSGGTGIPGPLLALAKELSVLPFFRSIKISDNSFSLFLSKLFNGTLLAKRDESGMIIPDTVLKFDLRGELGVGIELGRQAVPVAANECIVRSFYFVRRLASELRLRSVNSYSDFKRLDWNKTVPLDNPTLSRMLAIATGVFTTIDIGDAVISQKYFLSVNYVGIGRFAVAIGKDISWSLAARDLKAIKAMYENIHRFAYQDEDNRIYERIGDSMDLEKFGLTVTQTEILYNLEALVTANDIAATKLPVQSENIQQLKQAWLDDWKSYISNNFASFLNFEDAEMHWYTQEELLQKIEGNEPQKPWFRLALLEAMLFEPYFPLAVEKNKKGKLVPSKKYNNLKNPVTGFSKDRGDQYLNSLFREDYYQKGYIKRLRKCYSKVLRELNEVVKTVGISLLITAVVSIAAVATAGAFAPAIATALIGSKFAGLSGAALTNACLAYFGGGAIAFGGAGMAGGTATIVGGGAALGLGLGAGAGGTIGAIYFAGKKNTILQSAKLLVSVREIFLNDEHDLVYSNSVYEQYVRNIADIEKGLVDLRLQADIAGKEEKAGLKEQIKELEKTVEAMKVARKNLAKFMSSFEEGLQHTDA